MRLDAYIRVSQVRGRSGPSFISPTQQRERIQAWIQAFGYECGEVLEELDESGARADRPKLLHAIERIERGESDGLVVAKLDRFGRSLADGLQLIDRIRSAGGTFASVQDGFDLRTDTGRLVLRIMLSMAEYELDRVRTGWNDAKARAVMRGVHPSAWPPFGYRRAGNHGPLLVDPVTGPLVSELFSRRARQRESYTELARWLTSLSVPTGAGRRSWAMRGVKDIVRNRVYLGTAYAGDVENPAAHPPLTDHETWRAAQSHGHRTRPRSLHPSPLSTLMRCAGCRYVMRARRQPLAAGDVWVFTCRSTAGANSWTCATPARLKVDAELEDKIVGAFLDALPDFAARVRRSTPRLEQAIAAADAARSNFTQWRDDARIQARLGMDAYLDGLTARHDALAAATARLAQEEAKVDAARLPRDVADLRGRWSDLSASERRELLQAAVLCIMVKRRSPMRPLADASSLRVIWRGATLDLPRKGRFAWTPAAVSFDEIDQQPWALRVTDAQD
ncbi:MAG: site-specific recombinase [Solirubrobacteraceae bacterium]|jgi:DNA invertase Pin-like site-specific DNA recombinase|nr:site-specific recombinase [Solirubrobacteraceae bacterium]